MNASARHIESFPIRAFAAVVDARDRSILELPDRRRTLAERTTASPIYGGRACAPGVLDHWGGQMIRNRRAPRAPGLGPKRRARRR